MYLIINVSPPSCFKKAPCCIIKILQGTLSKMQTPKNAATCWSNQNLTVKIRRFCKGSAIYTLLLSNAAPPFHSRNCLGFFNEEKTNASFIWCGRPDLFRPYAFKNTQHYQQWAIIQFVATKIPGWSNGFINVLSSGLSNEWMHSKICLVWMSILLTFRKYAPA